MEFYYYVNIFETKGLEYILLILFLALFIYFVRYLETPAEKNSVPEKKSSKTAS